MVGRLSPFLLGFGLFSGDRLVYRSVCPVLKGRGVRKCSNVHKLGTKNAVDFLQCFMNDALKIEISNGVALENLFNPKGHRFSVVNNQVFHVFWCQILDFK